MFRGQRGDRGNLLLARRVSVRRKPWTYTADADMADLFKGLPDDRCQCEHWGYVLKGKVSFKTADGEETFETGDAYYVGPGHTPVLYAGTEIVEFSPTKELQHTMEVIEKNMESATF
jgi:hypothetical protein